MGTNGNPTCPDVAGRDIPGRYITNSSSVSRNVAFAAAVAAATAEYAKKDLKIADVDAINPVSGNREQRRSALRRRQGR